MARIVPHPRFTVEEDPFGENYRFWIFFGVVRINRKKTR
uniref:Uncharacterized protein n=1 Tax=Medicago truncatula TaxID=3880 RepID=I3T457_MEDTR|nr:unknown [Medicago truncatula]